jgi:phenylacetate-coenzyme A ligase PaaK-like adenylate-forming protein
MIWGHSHLLGTGLKGKWRGWLRIMKDHALGYHRFSAYQLDPAKLREAADLLIAWKPRYIIAYSSALDYFARVNADRAADFARLKLAGAFGTGESYPFEDSAAVIGQTLGCPAGMEYGSIETSVMGYSVPKLGALGHFEFFWRSYIFEIGEPGPGGGRMLRITSLRPRKWPLVRFEIGDEVFPFAEDNPVSVSRVERIIGKSLAFVTMDDGTVVHSVTFEHAVRNCKGVLRFQLVDGKSRRTLKIVAPGVDHEAVTAQVRAVLARIHPSLHAATIEFVDQLIQTRAGKTPLVVFEEGYTPPGATPGVPSQASTPIQGTR